ncbi:very short patch repair endonuclease [Streptomyces sp. NPDC102467]|uniref:very short patch repair endonuclease n=1 Tax=Streptomyces sp. NPDC102467 TaxID=3366179 RepID=UPI0038136802
MSPSSDLNWEPPEGSWASSAARRRNMQAIRSRDTKPELKLRKLLHAMGLRYRVAARPLPDVRRTADLVFRPTKVAVFIDGCYWHGCPEHYQAPRKNSGYWSEKVSGNMTRDRDTDQRLRAAGWLVLRYWEHEPAEECAKSVSDTVAARRRILVEKKLRGDG